MENENVKRVQELRRSNAATPVRNKKKYTRKTKHKKNKVLQIYSDLVSPYLKKQFNFQLTARKDVGAKCDLRHTVIFPTKFWACRFLNVGPFCYTSAHNERLTHEIKAL